MGINYEIDAEARIVRLSYIGDTTPEEYEAAMRAIFRATSYRPGFGFLSDRRDIEPPTAAYVTRTIDFDQAHQGELSGARWATVVSSTVNYGLGRMAQNLAESRELAVVPRIFTDLRAAEAWLRETDPAKAK